MSLCFSPPRRYIIHELRWWQLDCLRKEAAQGLSRVSRVCSPPAQHPLSPQTPMASPELPVPGDPQAPGWAGPPLAPARPPACLPATSPSSTVYEAGQGASPCLFLSLGAFSQCQCKAAVEEFHGEAVLGASRAQQCFSTLVTCRTPSCISLFNI